MKRLSVNVPLELHREAKVLAHLEDETLSSLVLRLLHDYIEDQQHKFSRRHGGAAVRRQEA
jgi:hypothetical protein